MVQRLRGPQLGGLFFDTIRAMTYELAKQLKDAGFPQSGQGGCVDEFGKEWDSIHNFSCAWAYLPTLEELIEALGDVSSFSLYNDGVNWRASYGYMNARVLSASTPTEAVARLWLALNKK